MGAYKKFKSLNGTTHLSTSINFSGSVAKTLKVHAKSPSTHPVIISMEAKIARFEWEIPRIERETRAYRLLEGSGLAPAFLGHVHENGRVIGHLLEKVKGSSASIQDLRKCEAALEKLHKLGLTHGDPNRFNFLVEANEAKLVDFERTQENSSGESMRKELEGLPAELVDHSGRGGGFMFHGDSD